MAQAQAMLEQEVANLRTQLEAERAARVELERNTATAFRQQMPKVAELERIVELLKAAPGGPASRANLDLNNLKSIQPETFSSKEGEPWKPWAKKTKLYLDGKAPGFRAALTAAEKVGAEIQPGNLSFTPWALKDDADLQLHSFLLYQTRGRALQIAEEPALEGRGFETW